MTGDATSSAITLLLENIISICKDSYTLMSNVESKYQELKEKVDTLKAHMKNFATYNHDNDSVKDLVKRIKFRVAEAEDAVDTYVAQAIISSSSIFYFVEKRIKRYEVAHKISEATTKLDGLKREAKEVFDQLQKEERSNQDLFANANEGCAVEADPGFDEAAEEVGRLLKEGPEQFGVVSIVGMLGLGKTTLARKVLKDLNVDGSPNRPAFVPVSRKYKKQNVFLEILSVYGEVTDEVRKMTENQLESHLRNQLKDKQFLVVLDDVWETKDWDKLQKVFPKNKKTRCRVLITTRNHEVARKAGHVYKLDFLPLDKSRELLRRKVFDDINCRGHLEEHEKIIASKCDGLPRAIVSIAELFDKNDDNCESWHSRAQNVNDHIAEETKEEIEQMYMCLEKHLKLCFLYLGIFPENFEIPVWKLVRLWIAEGLIEANQTMALEATAEKYLEKLVCKHLLIVVKRRSNDHPKTCRLHNVFREFCRNRAREEYLFREIEKDESLDYFRAIGINNVNNPACNSALPSGKGVRSFLTFSQEDGTGVSLKFVSSIPEKHGLLRVLEMQSPIPATLSKNFSKLVLLKYAAIYFHSSKLPLEISQMRDMETLIVNTTSSTLEIKPDIWKIPYLRHLHTNVSTLILHPDAKKAKGEEALTCEKLRTLSTIAPESCREDVFDKTPNLRKLGIRGDLAKLFEVDGQSNLSELLKKLKQLENLKLLNDTARLFDLPLEKSCAEHLRKLTLSKTRLKWRQMSTIADLEKLVVLKLKDDAFHGIQWKAEKKDFRFPNLQELQIIGTNLQVWEASKDNFPNLKRLKLKRCDQLKAVPSCLADISAFQLLVLDSDRLAESANKLLRDSNQREAQTGNNNNSSIFKVSVEYSASQHINGPRNIPEISSPPANDPWWASWLRFCCCCLA